VAFMSGIEKPPDEHKPVAFMSRETIGRRHLKIIVRWAALETTGPAGVDRRRRPALDGRPPLMHDLPDGGDSRRTSSILPQRGSLRGKGGHTPESAFSRTFALPLHVLLGSLSAALSKDMQKCRLKKISSG
jgi:hypothetical protein